MASEELNCTNINDFYRLRGDLTTFLTTKVVFGLIYSLIFLAGILGNSMVVWVIASNPGLKTVRNIFIVGLSCSDLVTAFSSVLSTPIVAFIKEWHAGSLPCYLLPLLQGMSLCFSTYTLTCIAIDRYILIVFPTKLPIRKLHAVCMLLLVCSLAVGISLPAVYHHTLKTYDTLCGVFCMEIWPTTDNRTVSPSRTAYGLTLSGVTFFVPLAIIGFCYSLIGLTLSRRIQNRMGKSQETSTLLANEQLRREREAKRQAILHRQSRTNRMLVLMVVIFATCWLPFVLMNFLRDVDALPAPVLAQEIFSQLLVHCLAVTSTIWNPILYTSMNDQFREAFASIISHWKDKRRVPFAQQHQDFSISTPHYLDRRRSSCIPILQQRAKPNNYDSMILTNLQANGGIIKSPDQDSSSSERIRQDDFKGDG